jgi:molybdopterin molybdotransferase
MVTATLFLKPLIAQLSGRQTQHPWTQALLTAPLHANGKRENYLRGTYALSEGRVEVEIAARQDSALTSVFADANCLVQRRANAPPLIAGDKVTILPL